MSKFFSLITGSCFTILAIAQPYNFIQTINPADTGLVSSPARRVLPAEMSSNPIVIDGLKDAEWNQYPSINLDRYIMCRTGYTAGIYSCEPDANKRTPSNADDFSTSFKAIYDEDYLYLLYDIKDNEVNDNNINPGVQERLEFAIAPYPDSAQQILLGKPYPPFSGVAPKTNMKFCYWAYLGAFVINFFLNQSPNVTISMNERADATKINYAQRISACQAKWKLKDDGTGYFLEAAISLKVSLADSANNPFDIPNVGKTKAIAFDVFAFDYDQGLKLIKASWNAQDDCVWDNMLYTGKMILGQGNCPAAIPKVNNDTVCLGKSATLTASGGKNYRWYTALTGGSPIATSAVFTTPALDLLDSNKAHYFYVANYDSCESNRKQVSVTVVNFTSAKINSLKNNYFVCNSAPEQLSATLSGGVFSGDGVEMGYFVPSQAKVNHINSIYYTYGDTNCSGKDSLHVFVFPCIRLESNPENGLRIYPNPSGGIFTVEIDNINDELTVQIFDATGRLMLEDRKSDVSDYSNNFDLSAFSSGIYTVKTVMNNNVISSKIIINP